MDVHALRRTPQAQKTWLARETWATEDVFLRRNPVMVTMLKPTVVDLYSGMGLASLAFKRTGFRIAAAAEIDPLRCTVYERNIRTKPIVGDLSEMTGDGILAAAELKAGEVDVLLGCPPCQAFSKLSETRRVDARTDERSRQVAEFAKKIEEIRPRIILFENVPGLLRERNFALFVEYLRKMSGLGYMTCFRLLDAANFGVPQRRRRLVAMSVVKPGPEPILPERSLSRRRGRYPRTVRQAISDLRPLDPGEADPSDDLHAAGSYSHNVMKIIRRVPADGGGRMDLPRKMWLPCHRKIRGAANVYGRLWWDRVASTITSRCTTPSCGRFLHPEQDRAITLREAFRLQTVPDTFLVNGTKTEVAAMLGDALPYNFAETLAIACRQLATHYN